MQFKLHLNWEKVVKFLFIWILSKVATKWSKRHFGPAKWHKFKNLSVLSNEFESKLGCIQRGFDCKRYIDNSHYELWFCILSNRKQSYRNEKTWWSIFWKDSIIFHKKSQSFLQSLLKVPFSRLSFADIFLSFSKFFWVFLSFQKIF